METSHDLAFWNIPLPHTSDEKGFQSRGWKYTPSSRVLYSPLKCHLLKLPENSCSRSHAHTHQCLCVGDASWCGHPDTPSLHWGLRVAPGKGPRTPSGSALWKLSCTGPSHHLLLFVHPQKVLSKMSGRGSNFQVLTTTLPVPPRSSNAGSLWLQV